MNETKPALLRDLLCIRPGCVESRRDGSLLCRRCGVTQCAGKGCRTLVAAYATRDGLCGACHSGKALWQRPWAN